MSYNYRNFLYSYEDQNETLVITSYYRIDRRVFYYNNKYSDKSNETAR